MTRSPLWTLLLIVFLISNARAENTDLSRIHLPVMQGATSSTEAQFNILVPRQNDIQIKAFPIINGKKSYQGIDGELIGEAHQDSEKRLHEKVIKLQIKNLQPGIEYQLEIYNKGPYSLNLVDTRVFKTLDGKDKAYRFAVVSCMADDRVFEEPRNVLWKKLIEQNPDFVFLIGDQTYVDSFEYVERGKATELDMWLRYTRSFSENLFFRSKRLVPTAVAIDDHDTGIDNGNKDTPTIKLATELMNIFYGSQDIPGFFENGSSGLFKLVKLGTQKFFVLDNRTSRTSYKEDTRYGHLGQEQEEWLLKRMNTPGVNHLLMGDMWGSAAITSVKGDGTIKRMTEGFYADHPTQYSELMKSIHAQGSLYALYSGDIHLSQIIDHSPKFKGTARYAPFETWEITSSPMHSIIFGGKPGEEVLWHDDQRIVGNKNYNFIIVNSEQSPSKWNLQVQAIGMDDKPLFSLEKNISTSTDTNSKRRRILDKRFGNFKDKVNVLLLDADDTLRVALSKGVTAKNSDDVLILPRVADKIAELVAKGYFIAIVSNQGGVKLGLNTLENADEALRKTIELIQKQNSRAIIHYYDFAEFGGDNYYSKPQVGMATHLERVLREQGYSVDWTRSLMVGDAQFKKGEVDPRGRMGDSFSDSDRTFAQAIGVRAVSAADFFEWTNEERRAINGRDFDFITKSTCAIQLELIFQ